MYWVMIVFTAMPHVPPLLQEIPTYDCPAVIERLEPSYAAAPGLVYTLRCEKRRRPPKKKEVTP